MYYSELAGFTSNSQDLVPGLKMVPDRALFSENVEFKNSSITMANEIISDHSWFASSSEVHVQFTSHKRTEL